MKFVHEYVNYYQTHQNNVYLISFKRDGSYVYSNRNILKGIDIGQG